jgi:hypothetical protein
VSNDEAAKILNVPLSATRQQIDNAYESLRSKYANQSQYATDPRERQVAYSALILIQDAYPKMTGRQVPNQIMPRTTVATHSERIPRVSLGAKAVQHSPTGSTRTPATASKPEYQPTGRQSWWIPSRVGVGGWKSWLPTPEKVAASLICGAIFLAALLILACR